MIKALVLAFGGGLSSTLLLAMPAFAQTADSTPQKIEKVEVTGSSIKRIDGETALPVQTISREDILRTGVSNVEQLLRNVTATSSSGSSNIANSGAGGGQGGASSAALISMRGLGSARTLVLINGRRGAPTGGSSAVDINTIPINAIDRIEILKDGASAVYGSDAVAGVVNFILRKNFVGTEVSGTFGAPTRSGGGNEYRASVITGFGDSAKDRYNVNFGASYQQIKPIFGADRSFARNLNVDEKLDKTSSTAFPANIRLNNASLASPLYPNCGPYSLVSPLSPGLCRYDNAPYIALQPDSKQGNVFLNGRFAINGANDAYVESSFTRNKTLQTTQHVLINGAALPAGHPYIASLTNLINTQYPGYSAQLNPLIGFAYALLPATSPYYPAGYTNPQLLPGQPLTLLFRSIPTGVRKTEDTSDAARVVAGVKGSAFGWDYDGGALYAENKITENLKQGWALTDKYLNLINTGVINPFGPTLDPAAQQAALDSNYNGNFFVNKTSIASVFGKIDREIMQLPAGAVGIAVGVDVRKEKLDLQPSQANKDFLISGFGAAGVPVAATRNVESVFSEVNVPILKSLQGNVTVRYDNYQRVGNTVNPKASLSWTPSEPLLFRASYGTGFRAPTLVDLYQPEARGITTNGSRDILRCPVNPPPTPNVDCGTQYVTIGGGNPSLKPEKSKSTTLGVVFEPSKEFSVGIDAFIISLKDVIRTGISTTTILADPIKYASYIRRGPPDGNPSGLGPILGIDQSLTNLGRVNVGGIDVDLRARLLNSAENKVFFAMSGTYMTRYDSSNLDGTYSSAINRPSALSIGVILRWRHVASAIWESGPWTASVTENYQVGYDDLRTSLQPASATPRQVAPYETFDTQVSYRGFKALKLTLGVKNIFDQNPPYTNYGGGFVGSYDLSYTDVRGRFIYTTATYTFK